MDKVWRACRRWVRACTSSGYAWLALHGVPRKGQTLEGVSPNLSIGRMHPKTETFHVLSLLGLTGDPLCLCT